MRLPFVTYKTFSSAYSIVIGDCYSGDARSLGVNECSTLQTIIGYKLMVGFMDVRFLQTYLDLYYYPIDRLLRVLQRTRGPVCDL